MFKREFYLRRLFFAFLLTNLLFLFIFVFSYSVSYLNYERIVDQNKVIQGYIDKIDMGLNQSTCSYGLLFETSEKLDYVGNNLEVLEKRFGSEDYRVVEQKTLYSQLEEKHFEIVKYLNDKCNSSFITILFFYSNDNQHFEDSRFEGYLLDSFKREHPNRVMIYSLDYALQLDFIQNYLNKYNITEIPQVVVNEKDVMYVSDIDKLDKYL